MRALTSGVLLATFGLVVVGCDNGPKRLPPRAEKKPVVATAEIYVPGMT